MLLWLLRAAAGRHLAGRGCAAGQHCCCPDQAGAVHCCCVGDQPRPHPQVSGGQTPPPPTGGQQCCGAVQMSLCVGRPGQCAWLVTVCAAAEGAITTITPLPPACRASDNPKTYLRMAQARIGLGPGEYDHAATLLDTALAKAREVGAPTAGEQCGRVCGVGWVGGCHCCAPCPHHD